MNKLLVSAQPRYDFQIERYFFAKIEKINNFCPTFCRYGNLSVSLDERCGLTICWVSSGAKLFATVISSLKNSPGAGIELKIDEWPDQIVDGETWYSQISISRSWWDNFLQVQITRSAN